MASLRSALRGCAVGSFIITTFAKTIPTWRRSCYTEGLEDRAGAHAGVLLARCVAQCELVLPGRARRESLGAEDGARVALVDL